MTVKDVVISFIFGVDKKSKKDADNQVEKFAKKAKNALRAIGAGLTVKKLIEIADEYNTINNQIQYATQNLVDQAQAQGMVLDAANATRTSYASMAGTIKTLINSQSNLFKSTESAAEYAELMTKAFRGTGMEANAAASYANSLASSFVTGKVSAGAIQNIMMQAPEILEYLAEEMGTTVQAVKAIGLAGQITARQMYEAITSHSADIEDAFSKLEITTREATQIAKDNLGTALTRLNNELEFTQTIAQFLIAGSQTLAKGIDKIAEWVGKLKEDVGSVADSVGVMATYGASFMAVMRVLGAGAKTTSWVALVATLVIDIVKKTFELLKNSERFKANLGNLMNALGKVLDGLLTPILRIINAITDIAAGPLGVAINAVVEALNICLEILSPILDMITDILNVTAELFDIINPFDKGDATFEKVLNVFGGGSNNEIQKIIKNEISPIPTANSMVNTTNHSTMTSNVTITNTFNGGDKEIQLEERRVMDDAGDKLIRNLTTAMVYGG